MVEPPLPDAEHLDQSRLAVCQRRLGHQFKNLTLLESALVHASGADHRLASNERMEFLGDAILGAIVCEELFRQFPEFLEGDLTKLKSIVVSRQTCAKISQALGLREFLVFGKGMTTHPAVPQSVLSDVFESLIAAIYLGRGHGAGARVCAGLLRTGDRVGCLGRHRRQLQITAAAIRTARARRDADVPLARREGPGPQQVLQDDGSNRAATFSARVGAKQEGIGAAGRSQCDLRSTRRSDSVLVATI